MDFYMKLTQKQVLSFSIIIIVLLCTLCSCKTQKITEYCDRDVVQYVTKVQHDTLVQHTHDSIYHTVFTKGDTVYSTKYVEREKWREKAVIRVDTMWRDRVVVQYKEKSVEKKIIPRWCYASLCVWVILFLIVVFKIKEIWQKQMF